MTIYRVIGCMTGTSCDGLDLAYIETNGEDIVVVGASQIIPFEPEYRKLLLERIQERKATHSGDANLAKAIAEFHSKHIQQFIQEHKLSVDAIGFHGQTVWHDPAHHTTVQLGDCQDLANSLGIQVIGQFRQHDVKNGGQGAPLVPVYHSALAANLEKPLAFLNIGGLSNVTFIGVDQTLVAGDTGLGSALIDDWVATHTSFSQDTDGRYAAQGKIHHDLVNGWQTHPFFTESFPKSLDRMAFHHLLDDCEGLSLEDGAATLTEFTAQTILRSLELLPEKPHQLVVCGGGSHNLTLMKSLQYHFKNVVSAFYIGFDSDAIEAQLMAYLAARFFKKLPSTFPSTTGVKAPVISGELFLPNVSKAMSA
ncbi:MAG: anhydro-N-acetylmuramic acid kinase [Pseudomonadota bacterium]|jgi:anhydro-N-acetylmuramic acid kinase|nr:anhydro-N-acetylmuramic acid kinase [Alphaproteobacteria bacterium]